MRLSPQLSRLLDVREGEHSVVLQASAAMFVLVAGHTLLETARDALFLQQLPPSRLTLVYVVIAVLTLAAAPVGGGLARHFGRRNALVAGVLAAAYGTALFHLQPLSASAVFALYAWSGLCGTLLVLQFWLFASELFTVAQGKRLFGLIAAGGALGAVFSSALAIGFVHWFSVRSLLLLSSALFVAAGLILTTVQSGSEELRAPGPLRGEHDALQTLRLLTADPYVVRLAALAVLAAAALLGTDYLFKATTAQHIPKAQLGAFFAGYYAVLNAASLVMQVFISGVMIRKLGVVPALGVLPALLLVFGSASAALGVPLSLVILLKASDGTLRYSIQRVANELLQMPLSTLMHERVKAVVDGLLPRLAQAVTAGGLLLIAGSAQQPERWIAVLIAVLAAAWLLVAGSLRKPYLQRFRDALARPNASHQLMVQELDADAIEAVLEALSSHEPARVIGAMDLLSDKGRVRLIPALILYHEDETVLSRALEILAASDREDWLTNAERLLGHASETVRVAALRALSLRGQHAALERGLHDDSAAVRAHATFWLVTLAGTEPLADPRVAALLAADVAGAPPGDSAALRALLSAIGDAPHPKWTPVLLAAAHTTDEHVFEQAARAMAGIDEPRFVPILIPRLTMHEGRAAVRDALVRLGEPALAALEQALDAADTEQRLRLQIPRTIARFRSQHAADVLLGQLDRKEHSGLLRYKLLRGLARVVAEVRVRIDRSIIDEQIRRNLVEYLRVLSLRVALTRENGTPSAQRSLRLVLGLLDAKLDQSLERVFILLQIRHKNENIRRVQFALRSPDRRTRAYGLEFLDTLTATRSDSAVSQQVRELLLIVADDLSPDERVLRGASFLPALPRAHADAVRLLLSDEDEYVASFAAYHALELGSLDLKQEVVAEVRKRPELNRIGETQWLFPGALRVQHEG